MLVLLVVLSFIERWDGGKEFKNGKTIFYHIVPFCGNFHDSISIQEVGGMTAVSDHSSDGQVT